MRGAKEAVAKLLQGGWRLSGMREVTLLLSIASTRDQPPGSYLHPSDAGD